MTETILSIKECLIIVFLIGLFTGFFYIRRLIKEEYLPIIKKYKSTILKNKNMIKENEQTIKKYNDEIVNLRKNIKNYKDDVKILEEDLLNIEHSYSMQSEKNQTILEKIEENEKIKESLDKELKYLQNKVINKDKLISKNKQYKQKISYLQRKVSKQEKLNQDIQNQLENIKNDIKILKEQTNMQKLNITRKKHELMELEKSINHDKKLSMLFEIDKLNEQLKIYKNKIIELKDAK